MCCSLWKSCDRYLPSNRVKDNRLGGQPINTGEENKDNVRLTVPVIFNVRRLIFHPANVISDVNERLAGCKEDQPSNPCEGIIKRITA